MLLLANKTISPERKKWQQIAFILAAAIIYTV